MAYTVKLKNQAGIENNYSGVEAVTIPLASGKDNATFVAKYGVTKSTISNVTYNGGDHAANDVDYLCYISATSSSYLPSGVIVTIGGNAATANVAFTYTKLTTTAALIKINGSYITGDIVIAKA